MVNISRSAIQSRRNGLIPSQVWGTHRDQALLLRIGNRKSRETLQRETVNDEDSRAILLMGATGAGKSSSIAAATGRSVKIGHTLESCTLKTTRWKYIAHDKSEIYLVDTPGFNDTHGHIGLYTFEEAQDHFCHLSAPYHRKANYRLNKTESPNATRHVR
ncbi:hypothetical protein E6O75_ATG09281 [Venturia nashicola]|uniref:G domain-containing protein n=1 Tax=Venturia nashicola TaxID=86259 RepID=A0A4Z1NK24_9PEZI|nr:hypothetical protein E6O75_ATG09281 [Venturia nashicola]